MAVPHQFWNALMRNGARKLNYVAQSELFTLSLDCRPHLAVPDDSQPQLWVTTRELRKGMQQFHVPFTLHQARDNDQAKDRALRRSMATVVLEPPHIHTMRNNCHTASWE